MNVLVVGSGAREHALAWRLAQSPRLTELHAAPGNPGIAALGRCHPVRAEDGDGLLALALTLEIDLVVIGPEAPLVAGVADVLRQNGVAVFGPGADAAQIEGSKMFAKDVLRAAGVRTAETLAVARPPCVVKANGLASGKGVFVCRTAAELDAALPAVEALGQGVVIEELLEGPEVSVFALSDGRRVVPIGAAQDFKRVADGDAGPNTGGMGAYSPVPGIDTNELVAEIHAPVLEELARRGAPFVGCLFAGLMITESGPYVLEFNARFGDPETQVLMPRIEGDLLGALSAAARGDLSSTSDVGLAPRSAVTVVLAAPDYPARSDYRGAPIDGLEAAAATGAIVFHGGTAARDGRVVTNGGRILSVTSTADTVAAARAGTYDAVHLLSFEGVKYRSDIAMGVDG